MSNSTYQAINKQILSDINRVKAQIKQLNESDLFSQEDRDRLNPIYLKQLQELEEKASKPLGYDVITEKFHFHDGVSDVKGFHKSINEIEVIDPEFL
ncbi:hypothetical protein LXD69_07145 [Flavobacterium sediminilitoris]|uniref:Uncharacterized protein n=1 Tax=Flavobacterium sediminilitoris TaxID=2024526 RepID=A0ABY4HRP8_9FLAO|nr:MULTISPECIES: hypothetical protein [Flavobacterium]UOX35286.1 hypothetical protein LXD69_07145 [Flavobacterium sediminilitoris]